MASHVLNLKWISGRSQANLPAVSEAAPTNFQHTQPYPRFSAPFTSCPSAQDVQSLTVYWIELHPCRPSLTHLLLVRL